MKLLYAVLLVLMTSQVSYAQPSTAKGIFKKKPVSTCTTEEPLTPEAFNEMIVQDITYAVVGESAPVSGIKVDITKPEVAISGAFRTKKSFVDFISFDVKAGASDRNISILKGYNEFNTAVETKAFFHIIPAWNSGKYGVCEDVYDETLVLSAKNRKVINNRAALIDTFNAVALIRNRYLRSETNFEQDLNDSLYQKITVNELPVLLHWAKKLTGKSIALTPGLDLDGSIKNILSQIDAVSTSETTKIIDGKSQKQTSIILASYNSKIDDTYSKYRKTRKSIYEETTKKLIENADDIWTFKAYKWFSFSPFVKAEKTNEYTPVQGTVPAAINPNYRLSYGINLNYHYYTLTTDKRANYWRVGASLLMANNISNLKSYNYETSAPFFTAGSSTTRVIETGAGYNKDAIKEGWARQLLVEYYRLPLKSFMPGLYSSATFDQGQIYKLQGVVGRENDDSILGVEGGLVFNINNREKDKNIVSILTYIRHRDITDSRRTQQETNEREEIEDYRKRNIRIGVRIGIPIFLPKRKS